MSLQTRLEALITAIGADIKSIRGTGLTTDTAQTVTGVKTFAAGSLLAPNVQATPANALTLKSSTGNTRGLVNSAGVTLFSAASIDGSGVGVLGIADAATAPSANPVGGALLYSEAGVLKIRQANGTVITIAGAGAGSGDMLLDGIQTVTGAKTFGVGKLLMSSGFATGAEPYSDANPPETLMLLETSAAPATPAAGLCVMYTDLAGRVWLKNDAGAVTEMTNVAGGAGGRWAGSAPEDHNFKTWAFDMQGSQGTQILPTAGQLHFVKMYNPVAQPISSLWTSVFTAGATLTNVGFALYGANGALLTSSVNANGATAAAFQSAGIKQVTFTTPPTIPVGYFWGAFWITGTTLPVLHRGGVSIALNNANLVSPNLRFGTAGTGLTTVAPANITAQTSLGAAYWMAAS